MSKNPDVFEIKSGIDSRIASIIIEETQKYSKENGATNKPGSVDISKRDSEILWIPESGWVGGMMSHFVNLANTFSFGYDIQYWGTRIQYTEYNHEGAHYGWHIDTTKSSYRNDHIRKLSISLCLSSKDDYDGGELEIKALPEEVKKYKMDMGDVVVFPSDMEHRVLPIKSGKRISLVGWYAGPRWK
jgi:PKHD-type hydroxylase